jgi:hypothetical protein
MTTTTALILLAVVLLVAVAGWIFYRQQRSKKLRSHFGPEYDRASMLYGGSAKAEDVLEARQKRMEKVRIHPLSDHERDRFGSLWLDVQSHFVDDPAGSIREADRLVTDVMIARGYPMTDFERRADDVSVDHPFVVSNYRAAHEIALNDQHGRASTEDLRRAMVCYRKLFEELLEAHIAPRR